MSVLAQRVQHNGAVDNGLFAFVKGSPESIQSLCDPGTLPRDYDRTLMTYTKKVRCTRAVSFRGHYCHVYLMLCDGAVCAAFECYRDTV
jgi:hypothetical protein